MRIYIASSFKHTERVIQVARELEAAGHVITVRWWDRVFNVEGEGEIHTQILKARYDQLSPEEFYSKPEAYTAFITDFMGVKKAQALVFVSGDEPRKYNGAAVELGISLADFKPCYLLGELENSVLYHPLIRCEDTAQVLKGLAKFQQLLRDRPTHPAKEAITS